MITGCLMSGFCMSLMAQKDLVIKEYGYYGPVKIQKPVMIDQKDVKNKSFSTTGLLEKSHSLKSAMAESVLKVADDSGKVAVSVDPQNYTIEEYVFYITPDRYSSGNLKIKSASILDVYLNGKKVKSKNNRREKCRFYSHRISSGNIGRSSE